MINRRWLILFLAAPALLLTTAVLASVGIGEIIHRYEGAPECLRLDPEAGAVLIKENVEPHDEFRISQGIFNDCENTIDVEVSLDRPNVEWIDVDTVDEGVFFINGGDDIWLHATVTFGNDTPAEFSAKDVTWEITRPE